MRLVQPLQVAQFVLVDQFVQLRHSHQTVMHVQTVAIHLLMEQQSVHHVPQVTIVPVRISLLSHVTLEPILQLQVQI